MPPPLPRSSTFSPGNSSARAVGLPQPSDARAAAMGISPNSIWLYKSDVMGSPCRASEVQQLASQQEDDACETEAGCVSATSDGSQQSDPQQDTALSEGAPSTCKAVRAYLALTSCRNCSSLWGTFFIHLFLYISDYEKSTAPLSLTFA